MLHSHVHHFKGHFPREASLPSHLFCTTASSTFTTQCLNHWHRLYISYIQTRSTPQTLPWLVDYVMPAELSCWQLGRRPCAFADQTCCKCVLLLSALLPVNRINLKIDASLLRLITIMWHAGCLEIKHTREKSNTTQRPHRILFSYL